MKIFPKILISVFILTIITMPVFSNAAEDPASPKLIPCGQSDVKTGVIAKQCDFQDFMKLLNNVVNFMLFYLALPIAAIMFAYAGLKLVLSPTGEGKTKAKNIFKNAVIGIILAAGAWLIVKTILSIAGYNDIPLFFN